MGGNTKGACDAVGMVRNEEKGKFSPNKFRGDFLGGSYTGGRVWGECWEIKDKIGEKKISGGQKFSGGDFWGNAKKGWKNFLGECWGSCEPQQILGGEFLEKFQRIKSQVIWKIFPQNN